MRRILAGEINEILCFEVGERPVWRLTFTDQEKLVVKAEIKTTTNNANQNIQSGGMLMRTATPRMEVELLVEPEFEALAKVAQDANRFRPPKEATASQEYLQLYLSGDARAVNAYYKMPFFTGVGSIESTVKKRGAGLMMLQLRQPPALFMLGKIAAVDQFIGNFDRFDAMGEIVNIGNFLFDKGDGGAITPIGLDFYNAQGEASNLVNPPPDNTMQVNSNGKKIMRYAWGGENLLNENNIRFFAHNAMMNLNGEFLTMQPGRVQVHLFDPPEITEFGNGMLAGVQELKRFLSSKPGLPNGVRARMDKLGWPYDPAPPRPSTPAPIFNGRGRRALPSQNAPSWMRPRHS